MSNSTSTKDHGEVVIVDSFQGNYINETSIEEEILGEVATGVRIERVDSHEELYGRVEHATGLMVWHHIRVSDEFLIGNEEFAQMKSDAILVNTARGGIVDRAAMVTAVNEGTIAQLAVDVVDGEPDIPEALKRSDRVLITPHSAFFSVEGFRELRVKSATYLRALMTGQSVHDIINGVVPQCDPASPAS